VNGSGSARFEYILVARLSIVYNKYLLLFDKYCAILSHMMSKQGIAMNRVSTIFLRVALLGMGLIALGLCALVLPAIYQDWGRAFPDVAYMKYPFLIGLSAAVIPFFIALYQAMRLLHYIDRNKAFSNLATTALRNIKYCAFAFSGLYATCLPAIYHVADKEDAPGLLVIGLIFVGVPLVLGVFAAVIQGLLQNAIDIKSENDLTV
jgi:hypothetical protein